MIRFKINKESVTLDLPEDAPLLWVLREELQLSGTKFGCGQGLCGACTVHLNGQPIRSCITPVGSIKDQQITTIEGLSKDIDHPVQKAWMQHNVPQCGYCQSGQIMSAAALVAGKSSVSDQEIDEAMSGNICRCGTYPRIRKAIHTACKMMGKKGQTP